MYKKKILTYDWFLRVQHLSIDKHKHKTIAYKYGQDFLDLQYNLCQEPYDYVIKRVIGLEGDTVTSHQHSRIRVKIPEGT